MIVRDGDWGVPLAELERLRFGPAGAVAGRVQRHAVNVPCRLWSDLSNGGHVAWWMPDRFEEQFAVQSASGLYDARAGLSDRGDAGGVV